MPRRSLINTAGALALVASVALNVLALVTLLAPTKPPPAAPAPEPEPAAPAASAPDGDACHAELQRCTEARWALAMRTIAASGAMADAGAGTGSPPPAPDGGTGPDQQAQALTDIARESLRAYLRATKDVAIPMLAQDLHDPAKQEALTRMDANAMARSAKLGKSERLRLEREYLAIRNSRVTSLRDAFEKQPPDIGAALEATKKIYADEDELMSRYGGAPAREQWRTDSIHKRTAILAFLASLGDQSWDSSLTW